MEKEKLFIPRIRIEKIKLENFKGVKFGEVELNNSKNVGDADILGLYGQNGSGKTTLLEALQIIRVLMMGEKLSFEQFGNIISQHSGRTNISIVFQILNPNNSVYHVEYKFEIAKGKKIVSPNSQSELDKDLKKLGMGLMAGGTSMIIGGLASVATVTAAPIVLPVAAASVGAMKTINAVSSKKNREMKKNVKEYDCLIVRNEVLSLSGEFDNTQVRFGPIFDTSDENEVFTPKAKHKSFFPEKTSLAIKELQRYKKHAYNNSKSFIFCNELREMLHERGQSTEYIKLLFLLNDYVNTSLRVLDSRLLLNDKGEIIPIFTANRVVMVQKNDSYTYIDEDSISILTSALKGLNLVLNQLIPGLSLVAIKQVDMSLDGKEKENVDNNVVKIRIYTERNDIRVPINEESAGIQKLISILGLFSCAFVNPGMTVAIDEIDAGVYEYLLGELLQIFEQYGQGQLIFTCHNLRPLEVLNKKFIVFTTTNSENRYIRPKNIRADNNLRDVYLREIIVGGQDEELYDNSKQGRIVAALQKAGDIFGEY